MLESLHKFFVSRILWPATLEGNECHREVYKLHRVYQEGPRVATLQSGQLYQLAAATLQLASSFFLHLPYSVECSLSCSRSIWRFTINL